MKRNVLVLVVLAVILGMVAGCGDGATTTTVGGTPTTGSETPTTGSETPTTVAAAYIQDVVNVGIDGDPMDLDPYTSLGMKNNTVNPQFVQVLGYLNKDGSFSGILMKSYEQADLQTVNVTLYDNIKDQAGNAFTATDAVWGLNKHVESKNRYAASIKSVEQTGDLTFTIHFTHDLFTNDLTDVFTNLGLVTQVAWEANPEGMKTSPVTTAPYKVAKYVAGSSLTLEKWDGYWKTDASLLTPVEKANVQTINYLVILEASQMTMALQTGQIDICQNIGLADTDYFTDASKYTVYTFPEFLIHVLNPNCDPTSPCSDQRVREAIFYAIDAKALVLKMFGPEAVLSKCIGNVSSPDYNPAWADADYWNYNPEKAKALLAEAGYTEDNPLTLKLLVIEQPTFKAIMEIVQGYLTAIGIEAQLLAENGGSYFADATDPAKWDLQHMPTFSSDYVVSAWSNLADTYSPTGPINFIQDPELQAVIAAGRSMATHSAETVEAGQAYINSKAYAYGIGGNYINIVYPSWISDFVLSDHMWIIPGGCTYTQH